MRRDLGLIVLLIAAVIALGSLVDALGGSDLLVILFAFPLFWHLRTVGWRLGDGFVNWVRSRQGKS